MGSGCSCLPQKSGKAELRDKEDLKCHSHEECCNKFKKTTGKSGAATKFILKYQRVQLLIHKKNESSLLGDGSGSSSGSDEEEDHDTSWLEELQEKGNAYNQQTNLPNETTETALDVTDVNSPSDDDTAAEEGELLSMGQVMFLNFCCCQKCLISILASYLLSFLFKNLVMLFPQVLM